MVGAAAASDAPPGGRANIAAVSVMVAFLRGVNVGGKGKLAMADLRQAAAACGAEDVRTYIQSGNLVFRSRSSAASMAKKLRTAIAAAGDVDPDVVVRTRDELARVVAKNPYVARGEDPAHLHVVFDGDLRGLDVARYAPEEAVAAGRDLYLFLPRGLGRSKLAGDLARKGKGTGTARNWRTVLKCLELADGVG